jgi:hypothetical protein
MSRTTHLGHGDHLVAHAREELLGVHGLSVEVRVRRGLGVGVEDPPADRNGAQKRMSLDRQLVRCPRSGVHPGSVV